MTGKFSTSNTVNKEGNCKKKYEPNIESTQREKPK
jgi:hypothetical protein